MVVAVINESDPPDLRFRPFTDSLLEALEYSGFWNINPIMFNTLPYWDDWFTNMFNDYMDDFEVMINELVEHCDIYRHDKASKLTAGGRRDRAIKCFRRFKFDYLLIIESSVILTDKTAIARLV